MFQRFFWCQMSKKTKFLGKNKYSLSEREFRVYGNCFNYKNKSFVCLLHKKVTFLTHGRMNVSGSLLCMYLAYYWNKKALIFWVFKGIFRFFVTFFTVHMELFYNVCTFWSFTLSFGFCRLICKIILIILRLSLCVYDPTQANDSLTNELSLQGIFF